MNLKKIGEISIGLFGSAVVAGAGYGLLNNSFNNNKIIISDNRAPTESVSTKKDTAPSNEYICEKNGADSVLNGKINNIERPVMGFNTTIWGPDYSKEKRCDIVRRVLAKYNAHFITTGEKKGYSILCASNGPGNGCINDANRGQIVTLGRKGINGQRYLNTLLVSLNPNPGKFEAGAPFLQTEARVYIDLNKMIAKGNDYTIYVTESK
jgi:Circadian oscillating protein COP23